MRDSDWSRHILLRSDWLLLIGATYTTLGIQIAEMTPTETLIVVFLRLTKPFAEFWSSCGKGMNDLPLNGSYAIVLI